jgi:hypothetical protein
VTHEELRALLAAYAAGALDEVGAEAVRVHLASGCVECLREVFGRPVGLPLEKRSPAAVARATAARGIAPRALFGVAVALAGATVAFASWAIVERRGRAAFEGREAARLSERLAEIETARVVLDARLEEMQRRVAAAEAEAGRQADAVRAAGEESARVRSDLEAAHEHVATLGRALRRGEAEVARLLTSTAEQAALRDLVAVPGTELLRLDPVVPFHDVRGHVLWHPSRDTVVLYAFGLPPGRQYRVRTRTDDGAEEAGPLVRPDAHGEVALSIALRAPAARLVAVEVVLAPSAQPVLAGRRSPSAR